MEWKYFCNEIIRREKYSSKAHAIFTLNTADDAPDKQTECTERSTLRCQCTTRARPKRTLLPSQLKLSRSPPVQVCSTTRKRTQPRVHLAEFSYSLRVSKSRLRSRRNALCRSLFERFATALKPISFFLASFLSFSLSLFLPSPYVASYSPLSLLHFVTLSLSYILLIIEMLLSISRFQLPSRFYRSRSLTLTYQRTWEWENWKDSLSLSRSVGVFSL